MNPLEMFVVYEGASDFRSVVVRRFVLDSDGNEQPDPLPCFFAPTVERAREGLAMMRPGLKNIGRHPKDEPQIAEVWV